MVERWQRHRSDRDVAVLGNDVCEFFPKPVAHSAAFGPQIEAADFADPVDVNRKLHFSSPLEETIVGMHKLLAGVSECDLCRGPPGRGLGARAPGSVADSSRG